MHICIQYRKMLLRMVPGMYDMNLRWRTKTRNTYSNQDGKNGQGIHVAIKMEKRTKNIAIRDPS